MPSTLQIGPLALSVSYLFTIAALALGLMLADRFSRRLDTELLNRHAWRIAMLAVVAARLGFVWRYRAAYSESPLDILNIRDGGWDAQVGLIAAWGYALVLLRQHMALRKPLLMSVGAATALWLGGQLAQMGSTSGQAGLPAITLQQLDGRETPLPSFEGKPVVVNLWATWCPPCLREMPVLMRGQREHTDVHYVFVNQGETAAQVQAYLTRHGLPLQHMLLDPKGKVAAAYGASAYPTTVFIDARGRLVERRMGELTWATLMQKVQAIR
jgi:thiol-disulfide isomerase/thioredoxin